MSRKKGDKNVTKDEKFRILSLHGQKVHSVGAIAYTVERDKNTVKNVIKNAESIDDPKKKKSGEDD